MFYNSNARDTLLTDNTNTCYFAYLFLVQLVMFSMPLEFGFKALPTIDCITSVIS